MESGHKDVDWCHISVSHIMQDFQTEWMQDIGDILLSDYRQNGGDLSTPKEEPQQVIEVQVSPRQKALQTIIEQNPSVGILIEKFELEVV